MSRPVPDPLIRAHLSILGRWCPGHRCKGHPADGLTVDAGRVLCRDCCDTLLAERRDAA